MLKKTLKRCVVPPMREMLRDENVRKGFSWKKYVSNLLPGKENDYSPNRRTFIKWLPAYVCTRFIELMIRDMVDNGTEVVFRHHGIIYMIIAIKDMKDITKRYKFDVRFRGHWYKPFIRLSDEYFDRQMERYGVNVKIGPLEWERMMKKIGNGMDYEPAKFVNIDP